MLKRFKEKLKKSKKLRRIFSLFFSCGIAIPAVVITIFFINEPFEGIYVEIFFVVYLLLTCLIWILLVHKFIKIYKKTK